MMASRTRHLASSASSTMAGRRDWESCRIPITSFTQSRLEMMLSRTSGHCGKDGQGQGRTGKSLWHCSPVLCSPRSPDRLILKGPISTRAVTLQATWQQCRAPILQLEKRKPEPKLAWPGYKPQERRFELDIRERLMVRAA